MSKKELKKVFSGSFSVALSVMGIYNILLLAVYFRNGRNRNILPSDMELIITDILLLISVTVIATVCGLVRQKLRGNRNPGSTDQEDK